jgi:regulator of nucleoside diphosphate kinase
MGKSTPNLFKTIKTIIMATLTKKAAKKTISASEVILLKSDFVILNDYMKNQSGMQVNEKDNFMKLNEEIHKAELVEPENFPADVVRLDSTVVVRDLQTKRDMTITVVMPQNADIKQKKVSVLAPVGTALIGFRKGKKVSWKVPSGSKEFMIMDVKNPVLT